MSKSKEIKNAYHKLCLKPNQKNYEKIISQNAHYSYLYAFLVLEKRFPEGEKAIAKNPYYAYLYARYIIKGRFVEAESIISENSSSKDYANFIIKGRFIEGELYDNLMEMNVKAIYHINEK